MKCKLVNENFKDNYTKKLLCSRGLLENELNSFYNPESSLVQSPQAFENINEGAALLLKHLHQSSNLALVVDSDVDGFTSSAIIYQYLKL